MNFPMALSKLSDEIKYWQLVREIQFYKFTK